jgi:type I restriction enzyme S subunit
MELAKDWVTRPLGEVVTFQRGFDLPHRSRASGAVPVVSSAGVSDFHAFSMVQPPGVVTGRYGTIGEVFFVEQEFWPLNTTLFVRDFHGNEPLFVYYLLQRFDFKTFSGKSGVPGVNRNELHREPVSLPSNTSEQQTIAAALGHVDALLHGLDQLIAKKRDLRRGAMQQLLTGQTRLPGFSGEWTVKRLGDVLAICHGRSQRDVVVADGPYPVLATGGQIGTASRPLYDKPSVLIGRKGTIDQPQYMATPFWTVDTLFYSAMKNGNCAKFFYYRFCLIHWMQFNEASGVPSLNARTIENIEFACPEPAEQNAIAAILSDMDAELTALEARRDKTSDLKQAMMQELLSGRTRLV